MTENEFRIIIKDILNDDFIEQEIAAKFGLIKCNSCFNYELIEEITNIKDKNLCHYCKDEFDY